MNRYNGNLSKGKGAPTSTRGGKTMSAVTEKPGFPSAQLPGPTQQRDRSGGVPEARIYPDSKGLS